MKRFTLLTMLVALMSVTAFAQKGLGPRPWQGTVSNPSTAIKGIVRTSQLAINKAPRAASESELVTPPATATVETWYNTDGVLYVNTASGTMANYVLIKKSEIFCGILCGIAEKHYICVQN